MIFYHPIVCIYTFMRNEKGVWAITRTSHFVHFTCFLAYFRFYFFWLSLSTICEYASAWNLSNHIWKAKIGMFCCIWGLLTFSTSIWATWVNRVLLKGANFWDARMPSNASWAWRCILHSRAKIRPHLHEGLNQPGRIVWHPSNSIIFSSQLVYNLIRRGGR